MAAKTSTAVSVSSKDTLVGQIVNFTRLPEGEESYEIAKQGVQALLKEVFTKKEESARIDKNYVDHLIEELDKRLSLQMDEILHHPAFKAIETPWRSLKFLVDRTDFKENIKVQYFNVTKADLLSDFEESADVSESGLFRQVYTEEFGQYGGEPVGVIIGNYDITPSTEDMKFLGYMAQLSAMTHAPFIAAADESFFGLADYSDLSQIKQLEAIFEGPQYNKWRELRDQDVARNIGLAMPRFMLRSTYGDDIIVKSFNYKEAISSKKDYVWGNAAFAYGTRLTDSFAQYRWCPNIIGPQSGGAIKDMPVHIVEKEGKPTVMGPVETVVSDRKEFELAELGFIPLTLRKESNSAVFFSSHSIQRARQFGNDEEGKQAELNYKLGTQLPYLFIITRLAHYIKVLQRENLGSWKGRAELEAELNKWIRQYVADQENPSASTRSQRPLRKASVDVTETQGDDGWYEINLSVTPHFKFMGANFTLSLTSMIAGE